MVLYFFKNKKKFKIKKDFAMKYEYFLLVKKIGHLDQILMVSKEDLLKNIKELIMGYKFYNKNFFLQKSDLITGITGQDIRDLYI